MYTAMQNVRLPPRLSAECPPCAHATAATAQPFAAGSRGSHPIVISSLSAHLNYGSQRCRPKCCDLIQEWHRRVCRLNAQPTWSPRHRQQRHVRAAPSASAAAGASAAASTATHSLQLIAARFGAYGAQIGAYLPFLPAALHTLQSVQLPPLPTAALAGA
jgi:hypothetical protein